MKVYIALFDARGYDTPDQNTCEILGVYDSREKAIAKIKAESEDAIANTGLERIELDCSRDDTYIELGVEGKPDWETESFAVMEEEVK